MTWLLYLRIASSCAALRVSPLTASPWRFMVEGREQGPVSVASASFYWGHHVVAVPDTAWRNIYLRGRGPSRCVDCELGRRLRFRKKPMRRWQLEPNDPSRCSESSRRTYRGLDGDRDDRLGRSRRIRASRWW